MSTDQVLLGVALTVVLAVGAQLVASRLHIPALILLLPLGFAAGALTDTVHPDRLLGPAFGPLVSLSVAIILYDAGLGLDLRTLAGHPRRVVARLIDLGVPITWGIGSLAAVLLLPVSGATAVMLGAILVVSGPTVVGPLLAFVQPVQRVRHILGWEGALIDPVGGILGAVVFTAIVASTHVGPARQLAEFAVSIGIGLAGGVVGTAILWLILRRWQVGEVLGTTAQLAAVIAVAALCDVVRDDTGLIAAIVMGLAVANLRGFDAPDRRPFFEPLVQLIIGLLFISISATVTPSSLRHLVLPALGLAAVLVLIARPLVAWVSTVGTELPPRERAFVGWMAPRGIVAASTASTFSASLVAAKVGGAQAILPVTFVVIVVTVSLYGLSAGAVARKLGVVAANPGAGGGDSPTLSPMPEPDSDAQPERAGPVSAAEFQALYDEVSTWSTAAPARPPAGIAAAAALVHSGVTVGLSLLMDTELRLDNPVPAEHRMTLMPDEDIGSGTVRFAKDYVGADFHNDGHSHIDALSHVAYRGTLYSGQSADLIDAQDGAQAGSIDLLRDGLVGRGVLLDLPGLFGRDWLEPGTQVLAEDLEAAEQRQGVQVTPGDILLVRTGHSRRVAELPSWDTAAHKPGLHPTAVRYLSSRQVAAVGSDSNSDAAPSTTEGIRFPIHVLAVNAMGLYLLDYLRFEDLLAQCVAVGRWDFLLVVAPLRINGGTGSPVNPVAIF